MTSVRRAVESAYLEVKGHALALGDDADLEASGVDSLDLLEMAMAVEAELGVRFRHNTFLEVHTLGELIATIRDAAGSRAALAR